MGGVVSRSAVLSEDPEQSALAKRYAELLGRGLNGFMGTTTDQSLLKRRVVALDTETRQFVLSNGKAVSLPRNIQEMSGKVEQVSHKRLKKEQNGVTGDASASLGGHCYWADVDVNGQVNWHRQYFQDAGFMDEEDFETEYRLFVAPFADNQDLYLLPEVEGAIPNHWDVKLLARFLRLYGTHMLGGIEVGRWKAQGSAWANFGRQAQRVFAASAEVGVVKPIQQVGFKAGVKASHANKNNGEETDEVSVLQRFGGVRPSIFMNCFIPLSDLVRDDGKKRVLTQAIAAVRGLPIRQGPDWDLEAYLDFWCTQNRESVEAALPPNNARNRILSGGRMKNVGRKAGVIKSNVDVSKDVYVSTREIIIPTGVPVGLSLSMNGGDMITVSVEHTTHTPQLFNVRNFSPTAGVWKTPNTKTKDKLFGSCRVDCRRVVSHAEGEAHILTGLQLCFDSDMRRLSLKGHFSCLSRSSVKSEPAPVWKGADNEDKRDLSSSGRVSTLGSDHGRRSSSPFSSSQISTPPGSHGSHGSGTYHNEVATSPGAQAGEGPSRTRPAQMTKATRRRSSDPTDSHKHVETREISHLGAGEMMPMPWVLVGARLDVYEGEDQLCKLAIRGRFALLDYI